MKEIIRLDNIKRDFHVGDETVHALRGVSFTIREGEFVTIMGTSGSGKSTLLNTLGCLDTPTSGEYYLDGVSVRTMNKRQRATLRNRKIGFVFQNYNLLPKTTAVENVELPLMYVIVTAAVYWGLNSKLRCLTSPLNLPAPGRRQPIYLTFRFRIDLCFC